jgi:hypothetical protein
MNCISVLHGKGARRDATVETDNLARKLAKAILKSSPMTAEVSVALEKHLEAYRFAYELVFLDEFLGVLCRNLERAIVEHDLDETGTKHIIDLSGSGSFRKHGRGIPQRDLKAKLELGFRRPQRRLGCGG